jgi:hypothetical protein
MINEIDQLVSKIIRKISKLSKPRSLDEMFYI